MANKTSVNSFPMLPESEIIETLADLDIKITSADLKTPTTEKVKMIFSSFYDYLKLTDLDQMRVLRPELFNNIFRCSTEETHANSIPIITFYVQLKQIFRMCDLNDFKLSDIVNPTKKRLIQELSALFNFLTFREETTSIIEELLQNNEEIQQNYKITKEEHDEERTILQNIQQEMDVTAPCLQECNRSINMQINQLLTYINKLKNVINTANDIKKQNQKLEIQNTEEEVQENKNYEEIEELMKYEYDEKTLEHLKSEIVRLNKEIEQQNINQQDMNQSLTELDKELIEINRLLTEIQSYNDLLEKYNDASNNIQVTQEIFDQLREEIRQIEDYKQQISEDISFSMEQYEEYKDEIEEQQDSDGGELKRDYVNKMDQKNQLTLDLSETETKLEAIVEKLNDEIAKIKEVQGMHARRCTRLVDQTNEMIKLWYIEAEEMSKMM